MICYCVFKGEPELERSAPFVEVQDQNGRPVAQDNGVQLTPHPTEKGLWRLGPFYIPDNSLSEFGGVLH